VPGIGITEFERHTDIFRASYLWARELIIALEEQGNSAIAAILATGKKTKQPAKGT
jgi:NTE family protein